MERQRQNKLELALYCLESKIRYENYQLWGRSCTKRKSEIKKIISEMMKVQDVDGYNMIYHFPHLDFHIKTHGIFL